jgi:hypothetical protein
VLSVIELECPADSVQDRLRHTGGIAAFESNVVLGTDASDEGDLFAAQPRDSAAPAEVR